MEQSTLDMFYNMTATPQLDKLYKALQDVDEPREKSFTEYGQRGQLAPGYSDSYFD